MYSNDEANKRSSPLHERAFKDKMHLTQSITIWILFV